MSVSVVVATIHLCIHQRGHPMSQGKARIKETAVELRATGLTLREVAEELNSMGHQTIKGRKFDYRTAWHYTTYEGGERCPRSGNWKRTCDDSLDAEIYLEIGNIFPNCLTCDYCKWEIASYS